MTFGGLAGPICWCLMWLAFIGTGTRVALFNVICLMLLVGFATLSAAEPGTLAGAEMIATLAGLGLLWVGLLILRAMLRRSVSLQLLMCFTRGQDDAIDDRIASRLEDAVKYGLVTPTANGYALSRVGWFVASVVGTAYASLGLRK
jgi:hypothetical protein